MFGGRGSSEYDSGKVVRGVHFVDSSSFASCKPMTFYLSYCPITRFNIGLRGLDSVFC
jgi:hypothetical protein